MKINLTAIAITLMIIGAVLYGLYYVENNFNECTISPLVYGAKVLEDTYDAKVLGTIYLFPRGNKLPIILEFNSTELILNP